MRIIVVSDTHGDYFNFEKVIETQSKADLFIHLGDGEQEADEIADLYPSKKFLTVSGNCDFGSPSPASGEIILAGKRIFYTHGHPYQVKYGLTGLIMEARNRKADIALYGHTHESYTSYEDGLYIMNPGSLGHPHDGKPTYGVIDLTAAGIVFNIVGV